MTAAAPPATRQPWQDEETLNAVRPEVMRILQSAPAFAKLAPEERKDLAAKMVKVGSYMANPDGLATEKAASGDAPLARAQADAVEATKERLSESPGFAGADFEAGAVEAGVEQFGELVKKVDFPQFVAGLIKGVFQAIVESSIEQMRAYGELLANVAKTVDQFARDNISENNARDWLADSFPDDFGIESSPGDFGFGFAEGEEPPEGEGAPTEQPRLVVKGDNPEETLKKVSEHLGLDKPINDLSDEAQERALVMAAQLEMARSRQQLLSSMVVLGINRIVVTDGLIHAKVVFDMRASDLARRRATASMYDRQSSSFTTRAKVEYGGWYTPWSGSLESEYKNEHVATVQSAVDETSESKAEVKAKLSGEVRVNFKSDYFPMEKLASPEMIAAIQGNAEPKEPKKPAEAEA